VLRWLVPFFLIVVLVSNIMLRDHPLYGVLLMVQCLGYGVVVAVHMLRIHWKPLYIPYYFILVNAAIIFGFFKNMFGMQKTVWESTRR
jgi:poly-beta-1,6-N-acetyl-D-glucosamine synthase